jgi:hypothetical protein
MTRQIRTWVLVCTLLIAIPAAATLSKGWAELQAGHYHQAMDAYESAAIADPESEAAWLGMQAAALGLEQWKQAQSAGARVLELDPDNFWALLRLGRAHYAVAEWPQAHGFYTRALEVEPESAEAMLGLGYTLLELNEPEMARSWCVRAGERMPTDARIAGCLNPHQVSTRVFGSASASLYGSSGGGVSDISSLTVSAGVDRGKWGLWGGATLSRSTLTGVESTQDSSSFDQGTFILGGWLAGEDWLVGLSMGGIAASDNSVDGGFVGSFKVGYQPGQLGAGLTFSTLAVSELSTAQLEPWMRWKAASWLDISLGPSLGVVAIQGLSAVSEWSLGTTLTVRPLERLGLTVAAFYGDRQYWIEGDGLSAWTSTDIYGAGYTLGASWTVTDPIGVFGQFEQRFGDDFSLTGGTAGVRANF